ncbi:hypothetical protein AKJ43_02325 [candidate division MSBL1 archaeon SCGC-AAA261D19]|uniref:Uncharacterized protein n=1 Tax=candidate division MSBL1 archaeon SCGC-AAA261D19 TaxID=1698273 RepID=A0A133V6S4_9EURY|nr:hypothetical protein AKJ43_02325 [candidate division MSBL1 archaeon SCGC-AAA261D19]
MREEDKKLVWESFSSVRAYLSHPEALEERIEELSKEDLSLDGFVEEFGNLTSVAADPTEKTDWRIFLNDLRSRLS